MIFCTTGTTSYPFLRLLQATDRALVGKSDKLVLQATLEVPMKHQKIEIINDVSFVKMKYYIANARALICHGGAGTLLMTLQYGKVKPFLVPRQKQLHEHVDDHQLYFCKYIASRKLAIVHNHHNNLTEEIRKYLKNPPKQTDKIQKGLHNLENNVQIYLSQIL